MEDFKIRKSIRCSDDGVNDYIEALEGFIVSLKAENTNRLIFKLDELNGVIADDVQMIIDGETFFEKEITIGEETETVNISKLKVLNDDGKSKIFDRILSLYGKLKDLRETANIVKGMIPEIEEVKQDTFKIDPSVNVFEQIQEKHYQKRKTK